MSRTQAASFAYESSWRRRLLSVEYAGLGHYEPDGAVTYVAVWGRAGGELPVGHRWSPDEEEVGRIVFETGSPARIDSLADISGQLGVSARKYAVGSGVGTPVIVDGRLWGGAGRLFDP